MKDYKRYQYKRVHPFQGLVIDPDTWATAHDYHKNSLVRHDYFLHRPGIVSGLEVKATEPPSNILLIYPGIAIDTDGNVIVVPEVQKYELELLKEGVVYIVLQARDIPSDHLPTGTEGEGQATRILEGFRIQERDSLPSEAYIELARIVVGAKQKDIRNARDFFHPGVGEIDLRSRIYSGIVAKEKLSIGYLRHDGDKNEVHIEGLWRFIDQVNSLYPYQFIFAGSMKLTDKRLVDIDILYMSGNKGFILKGQDVLPSFFRNGGCIWADPCHQSRNEEELNEFRKSFSELVKQTGKNLSRIKWGNSLLRSPFTFGAVPHGPNNRNGILWGENFVYTDNDLGCGWIGGWELNPISRNTICSLMEFGINIVISMLR